MYTILKTEQFDKWLKKLKDLRGKARVLTRIRSAGLGNFGDVKPIGDGISEMRIFTGPGYRVYFTQKDDQIILLLIGGDKDSQKRDIAKAKVLAAKYKDS